MFMIINYYYYCVRQTQEVSSYISYLDEKKMSVGQILNVQTVMYTRNRGEKSVAYHYFSSRLQRVCSDYTVPSTPSRRRTYYCYYNNNISLYSYYIIIRRQQLFKHNFMFARRIRGWCMECRYVQACRRLAVTNNDSMLLLRY